VLKRALKTDPRNSKAVVAAASIMQDQNQFEEALMQYRVAAQVNPNNPQLWNNIGMCFFSKHQSLGALSCLKKSLYLVREGGYILASYR
jgi:Bardet-Biedl syndrome 4 protein